jgi:alanine racemase
MPSNTVARIHLDHLRFNYRQLCRAIAPAQLIPVVKADAYGHGATAISRTLVEAGARLLAVAQFGEAMALKESGIAVPILIFGRLFPDELPTAIRAGFRISLFGVEDIRWIDKTTGETPAHVHVNVETGMGRVGVLPADEAEVFNALGRSRRIRWEGLYSHFATSDESDKTYAREQLSRFHALIDRLRSHAALPPMIHMANSGAIADLPETRFDACRSGIMLYGHYPSMQVTRSIPLKQVMSLTTAITHLRRLPPGHNVSYGRRWRTDQTTTIAVLPIGYADGLRRHLTGRMQVLIRGRQFKVVGTITMDQTMVDVGDADLAIGDAVLIWGDSPEGSLQVLDIAESMGTIPYELTCGISRRVPRVVLDGDK